MTTKQLKIKEIDASFSYKKNLGNFSNADFFFSAKAEVDEGKEDETAQALHQFVKEQAVKAVNKFTADEGLFKEMEQAYSGVKPMQASGAKKPSYPKPPSESTVVRSMDKTLEQHGDLDREDMEGNQRL